MGNNHLLEALGIEEGVPATLVPVTGFGYLTGATIGLKPVIKYPAKHSNWLDSWADNFDEVSFNKDELKVLSNRRW